jgi:hypothetical protein
MSSRASRNMAATSRNFAARVAATVSTCARTNTPVGWAKMVPIAAATISACPLGTRANTLRMKWTRQRCQAVPIMVASMAFINPR